jgi:hypothetical protein
MHSLLLYDVAGDDLAAYRNLLLKRPGLVPADTVREWPQQQP